MDCETIPEECTTGGPETWDLGERAVRGYVGRLTELGHKVTLFPVARLAEVQADLFAEMREAGADIGMHLHPQTTDLGFDEHLGQLAADQQRELIFSCRDRIAEATGEIPVSFRSGCLSISDDTYPLLADAGFIADSSPVPGREMPDLSACWAGAEPFAHRASATDHRAEGDLPLMVFPIAANLEMARTATEVPRCNQHLRLERPGILRWAPGLIDAHVRAQIERDVFLHSLVVMTHNTREYDVSEESARVALEAVSEAIAHTAETTGLRLQTVTLAELAQMALAE